MLVLSRKCNETINIGDDVYITILGVEGDKVKIGISAPRNVTILRGEIFEGLQSQEKLKALLVEGPEPASFKDLRELLNAEIANVEPVTLHPSTEEMPARKE